MADIIHFTPKIELEALENLGCFINLCRDHLTALGAAIRFDENIWDVTQALNLKGINGKRSVVFSTFDTAGKRRPSFMAEPFLSFAKAYIRYQSAMMPTKNPAARITALRALAAALNERGIADPTLTTPDTLNRAAQLLKERFTPGFAYQVANRLEMVAEFLFNNQLLAIPTRWRNPIAHPKDGVRVGSEFDVRRQSKLPSPSALEALALTFRLATEPSDVFVCSVAAILCSAPDRISEVIHLEVDCEVEDIVPSTGKAAYGLRWRPAKGATPMIKWIVPSMVDVVREAISNIRRLTNDARCVARWYEDHPNQIFLLPSLQHLRDKQYLTMHEAAEVMFLEPVGRSMMSTLLAGRGIPTKLRGRRLTVAFADFERSVLSRLPRGFPIANSESGLRYSNALCLMPKNLLHAQKTSYRCEVELLSSAHIYGRLGAKSQHGRRSVFDRHGFTEPDGSPIKVTTHQFRHYLNTLAQSGGLSQLDIAKWSGRTKVVRNKVYDHQSDRDILAVARGIIGKARSTAIIPLVSRQVALIHRAEFAQLNIHAAHTTEFGYCFHDFAMLPCQLHLDCLNCEELVCIKGDVEREQNLRRHQVETQSLLVAAKAAERDEEAGADRWVIHQQATLKRLDQLCSILDDPSVPVGAVIQATGVVSSSKLEQAATLRLNFNGSPSKAVPALQKAKLLRHREDGGDKK